jgi:hypothetical protein
VNNDLHHVSKHKMKIILTAQFPGALSMTGPFVVTGGWSKGTNAFAAACSNACSNVGPKPRQTNGGTVEIVTTAKYCSLFSYTRYHDISWLVLWY